MSSLNDTKQWQGDPTLVPDVLSLHQGFSAPPWENFFTGVDGTLPGVRTLNALRDKLAPKSEFVTNEFIPFMNEWCDQDSADELFAKHPDLERHPDSPGVLQADGTVVGGCPTWQDPKSNPVKINRKTLGWNAAAACFAYGYGNLALEGYKYVGDDQLIGGPWPDNEPAVSCME